VVVVVRLPLVPPTAGIEIGTANEIHALLHSHTAAETMTVPNGRGATATFLPLIDL
jgi:hypothetical protein